MLIVEETKKRGDNVVAVVGSSFFPFYSLVDFVLLQTGDRVNDAQQWKPVISVLL